MGQLFNGTIGGLCVARWPMEFRNFVFIQKFISIIV